MSCFDQRIFFKQTPSSFREGTQDGVHIQDVVNFLNASPQVNNTIGMSNVSVDNLFNTIASYPGDAGMSLNPGFTTSQPHQFYEFLNMKYFQNLEPTLELIGSSSVDIDGEPAGVEWIDPDTGQTLLGQYFKPHFYFPNGQDYMTSTLQSSAPRWSNYSGYTAQDLNNSIYTSFFLEDGRIIFDNDSINSGFVAPTLTGLQGQNPADNFQALMFGQWTRSGDDLIMEILLNYGEIHAWYEKPINITITYGPWHQSKPTNLETKNLDIIQKEKSLTEGSFNDYRKLYLYPFCVGEGMEGYITVTYPSDPCTITMSGFFKDPATAIGTWSNTNPSRRVPGAPYGTWPFSLVETDVDGNELNAPCNFFNYVYEYGCGSQTGSGSTEYYIDPGATAFDPEQDDISGNIKVAILELDMETYFNSGEQIWNHMQDEDGNYIGLFGLEMTSEGALRVTSGYVHQQNWQTPIPLTVPAGSLRVYQIAYILYDDCYFEDTQGFGYDGLKQVNRLVFIYG